MLTAVWLGSDSGRYRHRIRTWLSTCSSPASMLGAGRGGRDTDTAAAGPGLGGSSCRVAGASSWWHGAGMVPLKQAPVPREGVHSRPPAAISELRHLLALVQRQASLTGVRSLSMLRGASIISKSLPEASSDSADSRSSPCCS